jgi:hypothetical protein
VKPSRVDGTTRLVTQTTSRTTAIVTITATTIVNQSGTALRTPLNSA